MIRCWRKEEEKKMHVRKGQEEGGLRVDFPLRRTYSESGETSDMLWEVADWDGDGEGPWTEPFGPGFGAVGGGVRTEELKDAKMDERISRCSLDGCRPKGFGFEPATWGAA